MKSLKRRDALKAAALAAGGLFTGNALALDGHLPTSPSFAGSWTFEGRHCAIFQQGPVLLLINERGHLATGRITGPDTFKVTDGNHWNQNLTARVVDGGERIKWSDAASWVQA